MKSVGLILLSIVISIGGVFAEDTFTDVVDNMWYKEWIQILVDEEITSGYPDGSFRPNNQLKRIELLSFTMKALGYDLAVGETYWGQNIIDKALELGIIKENDELVMNPEQLISREETAYVIYNAHLLSHPFFSNDIQQQVELSIKDIEEVKDIFLNGVIGVFAEGIVSGYDDDTFKPNQYLTRAEAAVFIARLKREEKRQEVTFNMPYFEYNTESILAEDFKVYYHPQYQDLYNIMSIAHDIENEDVSLGFAYISSKRYNPDILSDGHSMKLYSNMSDFDHAPLDIHSKMMRWSFDLNYEDDPSPYYGHIDIQSWRTQGDLDHEKTMKAIFDYLFEEESDEIWQKYWQFSKDTSNKSSWEITLKNGRWLYLNNSDVGVALSTSLIENKPVYKIKK